MRENALSKMRNLLDLWSGIHRQRLELREHGAGLSKDIGISKATLDFEANRPFWHI